MNKIHNLLILATIASLSACNSASSDNQAVDGDTRATFYDPNETSCIHELGEFAAWDFFINPNTCRGCNVISQESALDKDESTAATILLPVTIDGSISIFATAPEGEVFPGGIRPIVKAYHQRTAPSLFLQADVRTYLDGELQDQSGIDLGLASDELDGQFAIGADAYGDGFITTTKPFDTLELFVRFGPGAVEQIQVYEFCVDSIRGESQGD